MEWISRADRGNNLDEIWQPIGYKHSIERNECTSRMQKKTEEMDKIAKKEERNEYVKEERESEV